MVIEETEKLNGKLTLLDILLVNATLVPAC